MIVQPAVERAFRTVPRHAFVPAGTPLEVTYSVDNSVAIKKSVNGVTLSSTSATFIQARMIEQAELRPGATVLEIGSGGYNAALLAEVVGPQGRVFSVDIDREVTDLALERLDATGYGDRVTVLQADAGEPLPELPDSVDAILVTAGAWDLAPAWLDRLATDGRIIVPLRMNGVTRSIGFRREGDHWVSTSAEVCGFVPMQGDGAHDGRVFELPDKLGNHVRLIFDADAPQDINRLDNVLATDRSTVWSGATIPLGVSFAELHLWFAAFLPGFCRMAVDEGTDLAGERKHWFPFGSVLDDSFAYLAVRPLPEGSGVEFGAHAYGDHGQSAADAMVEQIQAWDRAARDAEPVFGYWPTGSRLPEFGAGTAVLAKKHGVVTISWPIKD
ncbi:methyltransferase, FxLD system [Pseudonocardiaceae bacterium YIM PH 21723]|nr:methyltransferase, FxLD system [Pseudonocardiaceae bacterium YIM PH 21723]